MMKLPHELSGGPDPSTNKDLEHLPLPELPKAASRSSWAIWLGIVTIGLVVLVTYLFLKNNGIAMVMPSDRLPELLTFDKTTLQPGVITLNVRNPSASAVTVAVVNVNDSILPFTIDPSPTIPPLSGATIDVLYPWVAGQSYDIDVSTTDASIFTTSIDSAAATLPVTGSMMMNFILVGAISGLIPIFLGIPLFPLVTRRGKNTLLFFLALLDGFLIYLGVEIISKLLENTEMINSEFQGIGMIFTVAAISFFYFTSMNQLRKWGHQNRDHHFPIEWLDTLQVGFQNLGEGLAVGAAFSFGESGLGSLLIIGMILQNVIEGWRLSASLPKGKRSFSRLCSMGLLAGLPALLGAWVGGSIDSQLFQMVLLSIGLGTFLASFYDSFLRLRRINAVRPIPFTIYSGFALGLLAMFAAGLIVF